MIEHLRLSNFTGELVTQRLGCNLPADEALFSKHYGSAGSYAFWESYVFGLTSLPAFTHMLALLRSDRWDSIDVLQRALRKAMMDAYQLDQPFFRGEVSNMNGAQSYYDIPQPEKVKLIARPAAEWLYANPWSRSLVPETLAGFLRGEKPAVDLAQVIVKPKRGPKGDLTQRTATAMFEDLRAGKITSSHMTDFGQEAVAAEYKVKSRDTAKKAWAQALSMLAEVCNSDN